MNKLFRFTAVAFFAVTFFIPTQVFAYTDQSVYKLEIGHFLGEKTVKDSLERLKKETGWWAAYLDAGSQTTAYQIRSGGFVGEDYVKQVLSLFQKETGLPAFYEPKGEKKPYQRIVSYNYVNESDAKKVAEQFQKETGFSASSQPNKNPKQKTRIVSGSYVGENYVKQVVNEFRKETGFSAGFQKNGKYKDYVEIVSGGFYFEDRVKNVLEDFKNSTGFSGTYEPIQYENTYTVTTGGYVGEDYVKSVVDLIYKETGLLGKYVATSKANVYNIIYKDLYGDSLKHLTNFLDGRKWWYSKTKSGQTPIVFRIVSEALWNDSDINRALKYFTDRNWWVTSRKTGKRFDEYYNIVTESFLSNDDLEKAKRFFKDRNFYHYAQLTQEIGYPYYSVITEPIAPDKVSRAVSFFQTRNLWHVLEKTGQYGYDTYQILTYPFTGTGSLEKGMNFYKSNGWWATYEKRSEKKYIIRTGGFVGYDAVVNAQQIVSNHFGWYSWIIKVEDRPQINYSNYNISLSDALRLQMSAKPLTDQYKSGYVSSQYVEIIRGGQINTDGVRLRISPKLGTNENIALTVNKGASLEVLDTNVQGDPYEGSTKWFKIRYSGQELYVHSSLVSLAGKVGKVTADTLNVRLEKSTSSPIINQLKQNSTVTILEEGTEWHKIQLPYWNWAIESDVLHYLNPQNFVNDEVQKFQFLDLSSPMGIDASKLNKFLTGKGILEGKGAAFIEAAKKNGLNELYLISHALLETGNGKSELAQGVLYNGVKVYNMFGVGAVDSDPIGGGAKFAYDQGWTTPEKAIIGGAAFIGSSYVKVGQNTLYKMRWNPEAMVKMGKAYHQYATDIGWASKQAVTLYNLYKEIGSGTVYLDIPVFK